MKKLDMKTNNLTEDNIKKITKLFPNIVKEGVIDFDLLKQELSDVLVEGGEERYRLDWPGKRESMLKANTSINKTLRPVVKDSVDFENTENLYIEGDNFEVLKLLQESYLNKVKMIYIDPPYNTGKDFVYKDNTTQSKGEYEEEIGAVDGEGGKLFKNTDTNGRFHSDWLSMMYERLTVARDLLKDDGVIFISIDDNEAHNLRKIADEILGEGNFVAEFPRSVGTVPKTTPGIQNRHDYVLCYVKNIETPFGVDEDISEEHFKFDDNDGRGVYALIHPLDSGTIHYSKSLDFPIEYNKKSFEPGQHIENKPSGKWLWRWSEELVKWGFANDLILEKNNRLYTKNYRNLKVEKIGHSYSLVEKQVGKPFTSDTLMSEDFGNRMATREIKDILGSGYFDYPKPTNLIKKLIRMIAEDKSALILDFFSGSATTAHAVMQLNAEDGGNRKYIMVQLPEETDKKSEAYKAGYKTISDIGKERIRRASKKIKEELKEKGRQLKIGEETIDPEKLDFGFRVYKTDSSNMKDVYYNPKDLKQDSLLDLANNIKEDRDPEDLLTQIILDLGLELSLKIEEKDILGNKVFFVADNSLVACFDEKINIKIVDEIAKIKPLKVVFCDAGFKDDKDRINVEERFKRLSPETRVNVI